MDGQIRAMPFLEYCIVVTSPPTILVLDPAPDAVLHSELDGFVSAGCRPVVNLRRCQDDFVRARVAEQYETVDVDSYSERDLADLFKHSSNGFSILKFRAGVPLSAAIIDLATRTELDEKLRLIVRAGVGLDTVAVAYAKARGVTVVGTRGANSRSVAEHALGMIISCQREFVARNTALHDGAWSSAVAGLPASSLEGAHVLLIGAGLVSMHLKSMLDAMGSEVAVYTGGHGGNWLAHHLRAEDIDIALASADVVSVHLPLTTDTAGMINADRLRLMKPTSVLVNTSRGGIVDEKALDVVLREVNLGPRSAAVDVFENESSRFASPLSGNPHCLMTPHMAGMTSVSMARASRMTVSIVEDHINNWTSSTA